MLYSLKFLKSELFKRCIQHFSFLICLRMLCLVVIIGFISEKSQSLAIIYVFALQADGYVNQLNLNGAILQRFFGVLYTS